MKRHMGSILLAGLFVFAAATASWAQQEDRGSRHGPRARAAAADDGGLDPAQYARLLEKFEKDTLRVLQPEQELADEISAIFADYVDDVRSQAEAQRVERREHAEKMRAVMQEMRTAQADGDRDRVQELRGQLTEMRKERAEVEPVHADLIAEVTELLDDTQREKFDPLVQQFENQIAELDRRPGDALRAMRRVIATLQLTPEQRDAVHQIIGDALRARQRGSRDSAQNDEVTANARQAILDELDEEQGRLFEERLAQMLQREEETARTRGRGGRSGRPEEARPDAEAAPDDSEAPAPAASDAPEVSDVSTNGG